MTPEQQKSFQTLREGLTYHDSFGAVSDDKQVYVCSSNTLYEFASKDNALRLGDLRNILAAYEAM